MNKITKYIVLFFPFLASHLVGQAQVSLPKIFADNMVLQRDKPIMIWGTASPGEAVKVQLHQQYQTAKADKNGQWTLKLKAEEAGGPYEMIVTASNTISFNNVLVGEVWICSGQSNMEWTVAQSMNATAEMLTANYPFIRQFKVERDLNSLPQTDVKTGTWEVCAPSSVASFSGVGYYFAKRMYEELKVPIAIINSTWGGTNIETWTGREAFENSPEFREMIAGIPVVDLDSMASSKVKAATVRLSNTNGMMLNRSEIENFKKIDFDDATWPQINVPEVWETQNIGDIDGVVWLRKTIFIKNIDINNTNTLELSKIDDDDITYVNGIKIGNTNQWDTPRKYNIPSGVLKLGKNIILVRVVDSGGGGGIYGNASDMKLSIGSLVLPLSGAWKYQVESIKTATNENAYPSLLYNAMINPLILYSMRGVLWYQGESNVERAYQYKTAFPLLINDWRRKWNQGNFPFYFVQLATYNNNDNREKGSAWAELREAQTDALTLPNTGMCVTTDVGNPADIHPNNKQVVGNRLAGLALKNIHKKDLICNSPIFKSFVSENKQAIVTFETFGSALKTSDKYGYVRGFEMAGADKVFHYSKATISGNTVILECDKVPKPMSVRLGWAGDASENNLFNTDGLPAVPFRSNDWQTLTKDNKYQVGK